MDWPLKTRVLAWVESGTGQVSGRQGLSRNAGHASRLDRA